MFSSMTMASSTTKPTEIVSVDAPEVAFLGRSNVGKSSLINTLLGSKEAKVSSTPGRTRAINFFALHEGTEAKFAVRPSLIFADLPGYGYAKISKSISAEWPKFIEPYLAEREQLALCICLVDTNIPPQESDSAADQRPSLHAAPVSSGWHQVRSARRKPARQVARRVCAKPTR